MLGGTNNVYNALFGKNVLHSCAPCGAWHWQKSLAMTQTIATRKFPDYVISCGYGLSESIKKGTFVTKISFQMLLNEILKICENDIC